MNERENNSLMNGKTTIVTRKDVFRQIDAQEALISRVEKKIKRKIVKY